MSKSEKIAQEQTLCSETKHKASWKNVVVRGSVCAADLAGAIAAVTDAQVTRDAGTAASATARPLLDCDELPCPVGPCSQQGASVTNLTRRAAPYAVTDTGQRGSCAENQTKWSYKIRVDADVEVACGCPQPA